MQVCQDIPLICNSYFQTLLGHKYGYRPIPNTIDEDIFGALSRAASGAGDPLWDIVNTWYRLDLNNKPPLYVLQSVSAVLKDYNNTVQTPLHL